MDEAEEYAPAKLLEICRGFLGEVEGSFIGSTITSVKLPPLKLDVHMCEFDNCDPDIDVSAPNPFPRRSSFNTILHLVNSYRGVKPSGSAKCVSHSPWCSLSPATDALSLVRFVHAR